MLISLVSAKGGPGVTVSTLALTLAWPRPAVGLEADSRGSEWVVGYAHQHAGAGHDLLSVHMAATRGVAMDQAIRDRVLQIADQRWLLLGVPEPQQAGPIDWPRVARAAASMPDVDVIADCGAITSAHRSSDMCAAADLVLLVVRATAAGVRAAQLSLPTLRADLRRGGMGDDRLALLVVGAGRPYSSAEVAQAMGGPEQELPVVAEMPWDPKVAGFLQSGVKTSRGFSGGFARSSRSVASKIVAAADAARLTTQPARNPFLRTTRTAQPVGEQP